MKINFDPNAPDRSSRFTYDWATYMPQRSTRAAFKVHGSRGPALNAFHHGGHGALYRLENGTWIEVFKYDDDNPLPECVHGGSDRSGWNKRTKWIKLETDTPILVSVCRDCELRGVLM